jgi:hypothetical protein
MNPFTEDNLVKQTIIKLIKQAWRDLKRATSTGMTSSSDVSITMNFHTTFYPEYAHLFHE